MDLTTIIGLILCAGAIGGAIVSSGDVMGFMDIPSMLIVIFGISGATLVKWPFSVIRNLFGSGIRHAFFLPPDIQNTIEQLEALAATARRESVFSLEKAQVDDPFLKKAMMLAADNRPAETIAKVLRFEIDSMEERHRTGQDVLRGIQEDGPAFGMLGTLVGLVLMLTNLSDQASIGPAMAIALLTTFYGSCIANIFGGPFRNKLNHRGKLEILKMNIILQGTLGIVEGENPRLIKEKLNSFLAVGERTSEI